jgi:Glycine/serine hydroxymethyltransferase
MKEEDMIKVADCIADIVFEGEAAYDKVKTAVKALCDKYPIYEHDVKF